MGLRATHRTATSDAGDVVLHERRLGPVAFFFRQNVRPVSPTCKDVRREHGIRFGTWSFAVKRTLRVYRDTYPSEYLRSSL